MYLESGDSLCFLMMQLLPYATLSHHDVMPHLKTQGMELVFYGLEPVMGRNLRTDLSPLRSPNLRVFIKPAGLLSHTMLQKMAIGRITLTTEL